MSTEKQYQAEITGAVDVENAGMGFARIDKNELNEGPPIAPPNFKAGWEWLRHWTKGLFS